MRSSLPARTARYNTTRAVLYTACPPVRLSVMVHVPSLSALLLCMFIFCRITSHYGLRCECHLSKWSCKEVVTRCSGFSCVSGGVFLFASAGCGVG